MSITNPMMLPGHSQVGSTHQPSRRGMRWRRCGGGRMDIHGRHRASWRGRPGDAGGEAVSGAGSPAEAAGETVSGAGSSAESVGGETLSGGRPSGDVAGGEVVSGAGSPAEAAGSEPLTFEPEDVLVETTSAEGYACAEEGGWLVGLDTTLTEALEREGLARELVRTVQEARKQAGLEVSDRIMLRRRSTRIAIT